MKTNFLLFILCLNSILLFAQIPLPYAGLQEAFDVNYYDTTGIMWFEYTPTGKDQVRTQQSWHNVQKKWFNEQRFLSEYNSNDLVERRLTFKWNLGTTNWDTSDRVTINYDSKDRIIRQRIELYSNFSWSNLSIDSIFYGSNGKKSLKKVYWNDGPTAYTYSGRHLFTYDSNDSLSEFLYLWLNSNGIDWDTIARYSYSYNIPQRVDTVVWENYSNTFGWEYITRDMIHYKASGERDTLLVNHWNSSTNDWENASQVLYTYHSDESMDRQTHRNWDNVEKDYLPLFRTTYLYGTPMSVENKSAYSSFSVYPNPVENTASIYLDESMRNSILQVVSKEGRIIHQDFINGLSYELNTATWSAGNYFIVLINNNERNVKQVVKQ